LSCFGFCLFLGTGGLFLLLCAEIEDLLFLSFDFDLFLTSFFPRSSVMEFYCFKGIFLSVDFA